MRFITEEDLRALYRKEAFTSYCIPDGTRLTPGGRQYLLDKKIEILLEASDSKEGKKEIKLDSNPIDNVCTKSLNELVEEIQIKELKAKMDYVESMFLITEEELLVEDILVAQKVMELGKQFVSLKNVLKTKQLESYFLFSDCSGIKKEQAKQEIEDCFSINEFHVQLKNGKQTVLLHRLRCTLRELYVSVLKLELESKENFPYQEMKERINQFINTISQMICMAVGGNECQRKG